MFGSVAPILDMNSASDVRDFNKVAPQALLRLLLALSDHVADKLEILELVDGEKRLTALVIVVFKTNITTEAMSYDYFIAVM